MTDYETNRSDDFIDAYADEKAEGADKKKKSGPLSIAISAFFLVWFFGSIIAMIYLSGHGMQDLSIAVFGQLFLIFGIIGLISSIQNHSFQAFILLFPLVGGGSLFFSLGYHFMPESREQFSEMIPYAALALFFVVGLGIVLYGIIGPVMLRNKCTQSILGRVVSISSKTDDGTRLYCPTYEIYFRSETHMLCNNVYSNISVPNEGESVELFINPDKPEEFYNPKQNGSLSVFLIVFGLIFMAVPVICLVCMNFAQ